MLKIKSNSGEPTQNPARRPESPPGDAQGARRVNCTHENKNGSQGQIKPFRAVSLLMGAGDGQGLGVPTSCTKNTTRPTRTKKAELQAPETLKNRPWYTSAPRRELLRRNERKPTGDKIVRRRGFGQICPQLDKNEQVQPRRGAVKRRTLMNGGGVG